jgi:hypothetical protein
MSDETTQTEIVQESSGLDLSQSLSSEVKVETPQEEDKSLDLSQSLEKEEKAEEPLPEKYELTYGEDLELLKGIDDSLQEAFKNAKLTQEQAQSIASDLNKIDKKIVDKLSESVDNMYKGWRDGLTKHPMFVGESLKQSEANIKRAFNALLNAPDATPEYKTWMQTYFHSRSEKNPTGQGAINNPQVAELFVHIGKILGSDSAVIGSSIGLNEMTDEEHSLEYAKNLRAKLNSGLGRSLHRNSQELQDSETSRAHQLNHNRQFQ